MKGRNFPENLTNERVKTMNAIKNNVMLTAMSANLYAYEYQQFRFFLQWQEESFIVLRARHASVCSASLTG